MEAADKAVAVTTGQLFEVGTGDVALTSDDWYTPRWLFDAAGLVFDLDVCAPINPAFRTCPAKHFLTVVDDGLAQSWHGLVWCNPPFSDPAPWVDRFASSAGLMLVPAVSAMWVGRLLGAADAMTLIRCEFTRALGSPTKPGNVALILAARGRSGMLGLERVAAADKYAAGAYHVRPSLIE